MTSTGCGRLYPFGDHEGLAIGACYEPVGLLAEFADEPIASDHDPILAILKWQGN